jgi:hypothetical protein
MSNGDRGTPWSCPRLWIEYWVLPREGEAVEIGPVEYLILGFPGTQIHDEFAPAIERLIDRNLIHIIDLVFVKKDAEGNITTFEFDELDEVKGFAGLQGEAGGVISEEDISYTAAGLDPDSCAVIALWEDIWATEFAQALRTAGGSVLEGARVPRELVDAAFAALPAED